MRVRLSSADGALSPTGHGRKCDCAQMLSVSCPLSLRAGEDVQRTAPLSAASLRSIPPANVSASLSFCAPLRLRRFRRGGLKTVTLQGLAGSRCRRDTVGTAFVVDCCHKAALSPPRDFGTCVALETLRKGRKY